MNYGGGSGGSSNKNTCFVVNFQNKSGGEKKIEHICCYSFPLQCRPLHFILYYKIFKKLVVHL
jgi:hypothetical protein